VIVIDLSQIMLANVFTSIKEAGEIDENLGRHMILNAIRLLKVKFGKDYGEVVIACDSGSFWRKEIFPYYKANRKKARDESTIDWKRIFEVMRIVREELKENFPYRVIRVDRAEADDVIGVLSTEWSVEHINNNNRILVVSGDKDFVQLLKYPNVEIWDPINKKKVVHNDPYKFTKEHVIRGDTGDGIPNVLSPGNSFVMGIRQKPVTQKVFQNLMLLEDELSDPDLKENFLRNRTLIDLSYIPQDVREAILKEYEAEAGKSKSKMLKYFMNKRLSNLFSNINDF